MIAFLAFLVGVGGTILTLWLTGELWGSRSSSYSGSSYSSSSPSSGSDSSGTSNDFSAYVPPPAAPAPAPSTSSTYAPTASSIVGGWAPNCSGSTSERVYFYSDGSAMMEGEGGTWSLDGGYVNMVSSRGQRLSLYWEMLSPSSARVRRSGDSRTRNVYRCS